MMDGWEVKGRRVLKKQRIITLLTLGKQKDSWTHQPNGVTWTPHGEKRPFTVDFKKPLGYVIANLNLLCNLNTSQVKPVGYIKRQSGKMYTYLKPFSYCVAVGCWRKKSRWGWPGPAGLKGPQRRGDTNNVFCFWNRLSRQHTGFLFPFDIAE